MRGRSALAAAVVACVVAACAPARAPGAPVEARSERQRTIESVRAALPAGWMVTATTPDSVPDGWRTRDGGGLRIDGTRGTSRFRAWLLPPHWIGICPRPAEDIWQRHGRGVYASPEGGAIVLTDDAELRDALLRSGALGQQPAFRDPDSGWPDDADARAQALVADECVTDADRDGAISSLIVLGVPAPSLYREAARRGLGDTAMWSAHALAAFPGTATVEVLSHVVRHGEEPCVKAAAMSLETLADRAAGPALTEALAAPRTRNAEVRVALARALERIRWREAGPVVHGRLREETNAHFRRDLTCVLASLRYEPAIDDLRALAGPVEFNAEWILAERRRGWLGRAPGVALLRMTGAWSDAVDGVRLTLLPQQRAVRGEPIGAALVIENVGDTDVDVIPFLEGTIVVDGVATERPLREYNGCFTLSPNEVFVDELDLTGVLPAAGTRRVRFEAAGARTPEVAVPVGEPR